MDPKDFFRGLFGFEKREFGGRGDGRFPFEERKSEEDMFAENDIDQMFDHFHEEMFTQMQQLNQQMEEMFKTFGSFDFHNALPPPVGQPESPRDKMLKPSPDSEKTPALNRELPSRFGDIFSIPRFESVKSRDKVDRDLDAEVERDGIAKILPKLWTQEQEERETSRHVPSSPGGFFSNSSVSIVTIRGTDGKLEQHRTVRNTDGNEETTVTRQVGDRAHSVTTKKDHLGVVEETETFQNMDKDDLKTFEDTWNSKGRQPLDPCDEMVLPERNGHKSSLLGKLFYFSHWWK